MTKKEYKDHILSVCLFHNEYLGELHRLEYGMVSELWFISRYDRNIVYDQQIFLKLEDAVDAFIKLEPIHEEEEEEDNNAP